MNDKTGEAGDKTTERLKLSFWVFCDSLCAEIIEFEKWRAIRASVGGVDGVLAWVAWVAC